MSSRTKNCTTLVYLAIVSFVVSTGGCASISDDRDLWMWHSVPLPKEYSWGRGTPLVHTSAAERYVEMYENGWNACMNDRAIDIRRFDEMAPWQANGWPSAIYGFADGYMAADQRIQKLTRRFGEATVQQFLLEATGLDQVDPDDRKFSNARPEN